MDSESESGKDHNSRKWLGLAVTLGALAVALAHLIWPTLKIDAITVILLIVSVVPWLAPIFRSLELPGGWKVEFQDLQKTAARADQAGLLAPPSLPTEQQYSLQEIVESDPNLALAGLRIEIEKRLLDIAQKNDVRVRGHGVGALLRSLTERKILTPEARSVLADMTGLMNSAVHGATVDPRSAEWAIATGPRLLQALDDLASEKPS